MVRHGKDIVWVGVVIRGLADRDREVLRGAAVIEKYHVFYRDIWWM